MNSGLQKRLYEMEVTPPPSVWEKLSVNIDEINTDNLIGKKVLDAELTPPATAWQNISIAIDPEEKKEQPKRGVLINLKRLAAAAIFIGIIITGWVVFRNNTMTSTGLAGVEKPSQQKSKETGKAKDSNSIDRPVDRSALTRPELSNVSSDELLVSTPNQLQSRTKRNNSTGKRNDRVVQRATGQYASLNEPLSKSFNEPIDDLSLVTSDQNYLTMVNANGRLVKIPAQFANLAPHLQNKPIAEDYNEIMFGEGAYWKETLNEWRKKVASIPVSSGDAFTSFIELLKTVQDK